MVQNFSITLSQKMFHQLFYTPIVKRVTIFIACLALLFTATNTLASEQFLPTPQEKRANNLFLQIKCLVCNGQVIENSNSKIAYEMRKLIREKITEGLSNQQIKNFLTKNYGAQILTTPPLNKSTLLLWLLPLIFFMAGMAMLLIRFFKSKAQAKTQSIKTTTSP
jgi:cytochrome c-type biogenesis protein CcmH